MNLIKHTDLRIGNYVAMGAKPVRVEAIRQTMIETEHAHMNANDVRGELLTPEILIKMGAIHKYGNTYFIHKLKFTYEHNELSRFIRFHYSGKVSYIQYVHQLQNLYLSLIGQELKFAL